MALDGLSAPNAPNANPKPVTNRHPMIDQVIDQVIHPMIHPMIHLTVMSKMLNDARMTASPINQYQYTHRPHGPRRS